MMTRLGATSALLAVLLTQGTYVPYTPMEPLITRVWLAGYDFQDKWYFGGEEKL